MIDLLSAPQIADSTAAANDLRGPEGNVQDVSFGDVAPTLTSADVEQFISQGFIRIDEAFSPEIAEQVRSVLWEDCGCSPDDPSTWKKPVIQLDRYHTGAFIESVNTPKLRSAFDQLLGPRGWAPCRTMGRFLIRFPSDDDPGDTDWHVDGGFKVPEPDGISWRINFKSKTRGLLMFFLFSDVSENDAPTRISVGSHKAIARLLQDKGEWGLSFREVINSPACGPQDRPIVEATGRAGTVYLCHPFLVHAGQQHRGKTPRFMAQPRLVSRKEFLSPGKEALYSPVELAILRAVSNSDPL